MPPIEQLQESKKVSPVFQKLVSPLESVIQSEVSQKEKNKYRMLRHIYGI